MIPTPRRRSSYDQALRDLRTDVLRYQRYLKRVYALDLGVPEVTRLLVLDGLDCNEADVIANELKEGII